MKELGLTMPFIPVQELTRILDSPPNGDDIYVIEMVQNCLINADEKGTKAVVCLKLHGGATGEVLQPSFLVYG